MSLLDILMSNASSVNIDKLNKEFGEVLIEGEYIESAFAVFRDKWIFTNKRLILLDIQGLTGNKREYQSIPYRSINLFSIETAGTLDDDCEMKLWIRDMEAPLVKEFKRNTDLKGLQRTLAEHIL